MKLFVCLRPLVSIGLLCAPLSVLRAQFTITYNFASVTATTGTTDPTPVPTATGVVAGSFTAVGTPVNPNASLRFSFTDWAVGGIASNNTYSAHLGSVNTNEYLSVSLAPASGYTLSLSSISFTVQRSGTGIRTYAVRSDAGGDAFATNLPGSISPANTNLSVEAGNVFYWAVDATTTAQVGSVVTLASPNFMNLSSAVTFRFYAWNAEATGGTFSLDDVVFTGTATPSAIPEPSTYAVVAGLLGLIGAVWRRRRT